LDFGDARHASRAIGVLSLKCCVEFSKEEREQQETRGIVQVARAFRNHNVWLVLTWMGLILLMARAYS
jgi:hypothetical protein